MMPEALVSIMCFHPDTNTLNLTPGSRFSEEYFRAMQDIPVSQSVGTCGTAAFTKQLVITNNIQNDPCWDGYHDIAKKEGVHACWSMPILTSKRELLDTFAIYLTRPRQPRRQKRSAILPEALLWWP